MKMTYIAKHTNRNFFGKPFFKTAVIFLLMFVFIAVASIFEPVKSLIQNSLSPFLGSGSRIYENASWLPKILGDKGTVIEENNQLKSEIENLERNMMDYESVKYENLKLREELQMKPAGNFVTASVIAKPPQIPLDTLFIDRGTEDGIKAGDSVLIGERILIGKVVEITNNKSTVSLSSFAGSVVSGFVSRTDESLELRGIGGGVIEAKVPIDFDIAVGDKIMAPGSPSCSLAVVGVVEEDSSSGFKRALLSLPANISRINVVFVDAENND